jgi:hypothetical protein
MDLNPATTSALAALVKLTLDREGREYLQELRQGAPDATALKEYLSTQYGVGDPVAFADVAPYYCDRVMAGIDDWDPCDQESWVDVCQILTELTSSVAG